MLKYLRSAVTALNLTACVLLVALWVRSYWWQDSASVGIAGRRVGVTSVKQRIILALFKEFPFQLGIPRRWHFGSESIADSYRGMTEAQIIAQIGLPGFPGFSFRRLMGGGFRSVIPHWCPILVTATIAAVPWMPLRRFSVRTLLIATTLVAVGLGMIVAAE